MEVKLKHADIFCTICSISTQRMNFDMVTSVMILIFLECARKSTQRTYGSAAIFILNPKRQRQFNDVPIRSAFETNLGASRSVLCRFLIIQATFYLLHACVDYKRH